MPSEATQGEPVRVPVRSGPYLYVRVRSDGDSETVAIGADDLEAGFVTVRVAPGDRVMEVALSSTSDPDLDPARGQLWPPEGA
jgi:hypothetical protein